MAIDDMRVRQHLREIRVRSVCASSTGLGPSRLISGR